MRNAILIPTQGPSGDRPLRQHSGLRATLCTLIVWRIATATATETGIFSFLEYYKDFVLAGGGGGGEREKKTLHPFPLWGGGGGGVKGFSKLFKGKKKV